MLSFQNCAKQGVTAYETVPAANSSFNNISSSADVPPGQDVKFDQGAGAAPASAAGSESVSVQILDPLAERQDDIDEAKALCDEALANPLPAPAVKTANEAIAGIRGKRLLSPKDFGGQTTIDSITQSYGKLYVCGLTVNRISDTGGRLVLIRSKVLSEIAHHGTIDLIESEISSLAASKGIINVHPVDPADQPQDFPAETH